MPLEPGKLCAVRDVPDDDGSPVNWLPDASRSPSGAARRSKDRAPAPLELGELFAVHKVPDYDGLALDASRPPSATQL